VSVRWLIRRACRVVMRPVELAEDAMFPQPCRWMAIMTGCVVCIWDWGDGTTDVTITCWSHKRRTEDRRGYHFQRLLCSTLIHAPILYISLQASYFLVIQKLLNPPASTSVHYVRRSSPRQA